MITKKFLPVLLIFVGLVGWIPYKVKENKSNVTIETLSETHVNYKDAEAYTQFITQLSQEAQETEKTRRLTNKKIENEKIAKAKAEESKKAAEKEKLAKQAAEEEARLAKEAEEAAEAARLAAIAEEKANSYTETEELAAEVSQPAYSAPVENEVVEQAAPAVPVSAPAVQSRTDGFNFNGRHFDIAWFSGSGQVPADSYIYRWSTDPSHYLVEMMGVAGGVIRELHVGSQIVIDGQRYTIFHMQSGVPNDENAYYNMKDVGAAITFQTCDYQIGANGRYNLTIWYANPS